MYTLEYCKKHFKYLNQGSSRCVYEFDDNHVIKIPLEIFSGDGIEQNRDELEVYARFGSTFPLCALDPRSTEEYIIMEKVQPLDEIYVDAISDNIDAAFREFATLKYDLDVFLGKELYQLYELDVRFINFLKELSKNSVDIIDAVTYDVCSFNLGLKGDRILMLDYGLYMGNLIKENVLD